MGNRRSARHSESVRKEFGALRRVLSEYRVVGCFVLGLSRVGVGRGRHLRGAKGSAHRAVLEPKALECGSAQSARARKVLQRAVGAVRAEISEQMRSVHRRTAADDGGLHLMRIITIDVDVDIRNSNSGDGNGFCGFIPPSNKHSNDFMSGQILFNYILIGLALSEKKK